MELDCSKISENYSKNSFELMPNDEKFESILQPVLAMIQHKLKGNYLYAEEYLIKFLQQNRTKMKTEDIMDLSKHMSACIAHLYIILVSMMLSFTIGFPLAFCLKTCYRKTSNPNKYKYWLFTQSVVFTGAMGFLLIGSGTSWKIGIQSQRFMQRFSKEYANVLETMNQTEMQFKVNCEKLHAAVDHNLMKIRNLTGNIYEDIANVLDEKTGAEYLSSLEKFNRSVKNMEEVLNSIGFTSIENKPTSRIVNLIDELHYETYRISQYFLGTFSNTNDEIAVEERTMSDIVFPKDHVYPDWEEFYYEIAIILNVLFPNVNSTIRFVDAMKRNLGKVHEENLKTIAAQIQRIQDFISSKCAMISEAIGLLSVDRLEHVFSKCTNLKLKPRTSSTHSVPQRKSPTVFGKMQSRVFSAFVKVETWIFLFPSIYGFTVFFFFIIGFVGACKEVYSISRGNISTDTYTVTFFKIAIRISVIFLWLILLITAFLYFIHIPAVVICGTLKKDKLTDRYLDRPYWDNETWIMSKLNKYVHHLRKPITVKDLLMECRQNKTIFKSFHLEKHINDHYESSLARTVQESKVKYVQVIKRQIVTNFKDVMMHVNFIDHRMDMGFLSKIKSDLNKTERGIDLLQERLPHMNLTRKDLLETNVNEMRQLIAQMHVFLEEFAKAKLLVHVVKDELLQLVAINARLDNIRKNVLIPDVDAYLNNVTEHIKCLHEETELFIRDSLLREFGNCNFLPHIYDKLEWLVCDYGLKLMNCLWFSLAIIGFSIIIASILACRIACYVRGSYKIHGKQLLNCHQRYSDRQSAIISGTDSKEVEKPGYEK